MEKSKYSAGLIGCILFLICAVCYSFVSSLSLQGKSTKPPLYVATSGMWSKDILGMSYVTDALTRNFTLIPDDENYDLMIMSIFGNTELKIRQEAVRLMWVGEPVPVSLTDADVAIGSDFINSEKYVRISIGMCKDAEIGAVHKINKTNRKFCCFLYSANNPWFKGGKNFYKHRQDFFKVLCKYKHVDSGGDVLNNIGYKVPSEDTIEWLSNYKFVIAFENCAFDGYVTEKLFNAYYSGAIPIWCGAPSALVGINKKAIIYAGDFQSLQDLAEYVAKVDQDPVLYNEIWNQPLVISKESSYMHLTAELEKKILKALQKKEIIKINDGMIRMTGRSQYAIRERENMKQRLVTWLERFF